MPSHPHCHWRGAQDWKDAGLEMSTTSDEACKLFDASLTQMVNFWDDEATGGMEKCISKMVTADPEFVMGHVIKTSFSGKRVQDDNNFAQSVYKMAELAEKDHVKPWERKHAKAALMMSEGKTDKAIDIWEDILLEKPTDMLALRLLHDTYITTGYSQQLRDSCGRVLPFWKPEMPMYGDLLGMVAFGLNETNFFVQSEKMARQALDFNRHDTWASHCVAHVKEMTGSYEAGIKFLEETESNWNFSNLTCHTYWHWALYYYENGDFESCVGILDNHILPLMKKNQSMFSVTDAASLSFRLSAEGYDLGARWGDVYDVAKDHEDDHTWSYSDVNVMLACMGAQKKDDSKHLIQGIKDYIKNGSGDIKGVYQEVTLPMLEAIQAFDDQEFGKAVEIFKPIKYSAYKIGGSVAQRDVLNVFGIHAALNSKDPQHQRYASHLLMERQSLKGETPLVQRLLGRLINSH